MNPEPEVEPPAPPMQSLGAHALLRGKQVAITAAAGAGIGSATARRFLAEGASLAVISDVHQRRLQEAKARLSEEFGAEKVVAVQCDVTRSADVARLLDVIKSVGGVDVLVNNAGLGGTNSIIDIDDDEWDRIISVTLTSCFRMTRGVAQLMVANGTSGVILNISSVIAWRAQAGQAHYAAAKAGVSALTRSAAADLAQYGIRVNAVSPSFASHAFLAKVVPAAELAELERRELFGRGATTDEVASVLTFLACDYSSYMSGEVVSVSSQHP